jgi:acyl carrier protein
MTETQSTPLSAEELRPVVREVWEKVLGHADFTDEDRFLSIPGGNSLTAVQVIVALSGRLGTRIPARLIMRHRTVTELASALSERADT